MTIIKLLLIAIPILITLTSCQTGEPAPIVGTPAVTRTQSARGAEQASPETALVYAEIENAPRAFPILYRTTATPHGMHEPAEGAYIGAWLSPETPMRIFENQVSLHHAIYTHEMQLSEEIPITWLLHCIAMQATPLIIITPDETPHEDIHPTQMIIYQAQRLGSFNLPMFIAFFPPEFIGNISPTEYTIMFRFARSVFSSHAPLASFVWTAPYFDATPQNPFYPGHDAVDWVALSLLATRDHEGEKSDIFSQLEIFYHHFQSHKPIMLLPLGISHFSRGDYTYRTHETAAEIRQVYDTLRSFPRIGAVIYADNLTLSPESWNDFSISAEPILLAAYHEAIAHPHFLSILETNAAAATRWTRSKNQGYYWEGRIYISAQTLSNELNIPLPRQSTEINNHHFAEARHLSGLNITACQDQHVIFIDGHLD
ncbi:MAG: hypothetical protein FWE05_02110 [Defluviitaleaceae bacterium]|nr:hypothetical protein [Defluviitaleaceae bacterium]